MNTLYYYTKSKADIDIIDNIMQNFDQKVVDQLQRVEVLTAQNNKLRLKGNYIDNENNEIYFPSQIVNPNIFRVRNNIYCTGENMEITLYALPGKNYTYKFV